MCYSFRTSLISYALGIASGIFALVTGQWILGCLILAYAQMQLSEAMIWFGIDTKSSEWNKRGTSYGKYLLATHNIAIGLGIVFATIFTAKKTLEWQDFMPMIIGLLFFLFVVFYYYLPQTYPDVTFPENQVCDRNCQSAENRLKWPFPHGWYIFSYVISITLMILYVKPADTKILMLTFFSMLFAVTFLIFPRTVGSVWCWSTSFCAPVIVILNYLLIRHRTTGNIFT